MIENSKLKIENSLTKPQTFFVKVFGCQYNEWDGDRLGFKLKNSGLIESTEKSPNNYREQDPPFKIAVLATIIIWHKSLISPTSHF